MDIYITKGILEDLVIIVGLIVVQFVYAGNSVILSYLMSLGLSPLSIVIFSTSATFLIMSPFAVYFERSKWPKNFSFKLMIQLFSIAFAGVTLFQSLFLEGINRTSPALAIAMPNIAPGLIFIIAWVFRLEKVNISCTYSKVKIVGTLFCVAGALTMSLMHSAVKGKAPFSVPSIDMMFDKQKIIGCLYLMAAVLVLASNVVLQAKTLFGFPAPMSLCAITSLLGVMLTESVQLLQKHKLEFDWPLVGIRDLIGYSLVGGAVSGACFSFNGWAMRKRGPVLVSMFNPIGTVVSVVLSVITLGDPINVGSLAGMFLMFTGLYLVLWAKGKEGFEDRNTLESHWDSEKPLLS